MAVQILRSTTTATIVALDTDERRLEQARELGADETLMSDSQAAGSIMAMTGGVGADLVLDFVGVTPTLATAAAAIRSGGQITVVGLGGGELPFRSIPVPVELPWGTAIARPYGGSRRDLQEVVALALQGQVDVDVTRLDLDDAAKALDELEAGEILGRAVLVPSAS